MTILCGTDFSEAAGRAVHVAACLAARLQTSLHLVHAAQYAQGEESLLSQHVAITQLLDRAAERARACGAHVRTQIEDGPPDEALLRVAKRDEAELIVVGALGTRLPGVWQLGSHVERLAQHSHVPVLVVRDDQALVSWLTERRPLRIVLGADFSPSSDDAARLVERWRAAAPCQVTAVHLYWPSEEFARLGLSGVRSYLDPDPDVTRTLVRDLKQRLAPKDDAESFEVVVEPHFGRLGDRLADIAAQRGADLLVVGSQARGLLGRVREASVSYWALHNARSSVLCVPAAASSVHDHVPRLRNVLVATDFSAAGNAAIGLAYALAEPGGTVHIVHVVPQPHADPLTPHDVFALERSDTTHARARRSEIHGALAALVPPDVRARCTLFHALESNDAAAAICQAAARLDADAICLGRRGRSNLAETLLGSVSKHVLSSAQCPVMLAHPSRA